MNTKPIPIIITLIAALISCIMSILQRVEFSVFVYRLFVVVLVFLVMGTIIKMVLDFSFRTLEPTISIDDGLDTVADATNPQDDTTPEEDVETTEQNEDQTESEEG